MAQRPDHERTDPNGSLGVSLGIFTTLMIAAIAFIVFFGGPSRYVEGAGLPDTVSSNLAAQSAAPDVNLPGQVLTARSSAAGNR